MNKCLEIIMRNQDKSIAKLETTTSWNISETLKQLDSDLIGVEKYFCDELDENFGFILEDQMDGKYNSLFLKTFKDLYAKVISQVKVRGADELPSEIDPNYDPELLKERFTQGYKNILENLRGIEEGISGNIINEHDYSLITKGNKQKNKFVFYEILNHIYINSAPVVSHKDLADYYFFKPIGGGTIEFGHSTIEISDLAADYGYEPRLITAMIFKKEYPNKDIIIAEY